MKRFMFILVLLVLLLLPVRAVADHVTEPTVPIDEIVALNIYDYPNFTTRLIACDGSEERAWNSMRIEPKLSFETPNGPASNREPSEHFTVRVVVSRVTENGGDLNFRKDWDALWFHQNRKPHATSPQDLEVTQSNSYFLQEHLGLWHVEIKIFGDVSGKELIRTCMLRVISQTLGIADDGLLVLVVVLSVVGVAVVGTVLRRKRR